MDQQTPQYREENRRLQDTFEEIDRQRSDIGPVYRGQDFTEQLLEEKREESRQRLALLNNDPYFGRLDFREDGKTEPQPLYIGKRGMDLKKTGEPYVIDWRAPVASLFYSFTGGEAPVEYEAPEGIIGGDVHLKRNLSIRDRELQRVVDSYERGGDNIGLNDEFLLYKLGDKKDNRLRDIVSTIQAEQDQIIRAPRYKALIIQGAAGSGKTTVALHRLAFLLYQYQQQIKAERMVIFAPNTMFLDYISGVLPELGVGNVKQTTFAEWATDRLNANVRLAPGTTEGNVWFSLEGKRPAINDETPGRFKGSLAFKAWIDDRLTELESQFLGEQMQPFEAWDGRALSVEVIREWFEVEYRHYSLASRRDRLTARINRWLEMQLNTIGDPKIRKDKSKTGKQRLRAYTNKLPKADALEFYKSLFAPPSSGSDATPIPGKIVKETQAYLKKGYVQPEDLPALVWIHYRFNGAENLIFDHVVVDEAQDVSPFQIALLNAFMNEPSFTILGDLAQGIHAYRGVQRWEELSAVFDDEHNSYHVLQQSYRSTLEIIEFANRILSHTDTGLPPAVPVFRSGDPVDIVRLDNQEERLPFIRTFLEDNRERGMRTIAIIGRTDEACIRLHEELQAGGIDANLISEGQTQYRGGVTIVPVYLAKGLEFDAVLVADAGERQYALNPQDAKLLYVGCTRALHRLTLYSYGNVTPLIS
ncbi:DNA helicase UvrD [Cohnella endophytica]|uniref:DNA helicase UvrD n=1 Tax=Cohnella endophytica TaxID=2419778 RepID=A0A494XEF8_9BACL|nr:UvrD-helicase domain-containing protein [Cohnella endophytica]RKP48041.1 DNA helicase UvrD [Cohnella endophytica]